MQRYPLLAFCLLACSSTTAPRAPEPVARIPAAPLVAPEPVVEAPPPAPPPPADHGFAPSPLTGIANRVIDLACAVVERRPLPEPPFPIAPEPSPSETESLIRESSRELLESCRELEFFLVATELTLAPGASPPATQPVRGLEVVVLLTRVGLKIATLDSGRASRYAPEGAMRDVATAGKELGDAICADRGLALVLGEPERAVIAKDELWEKVQRRLPKEEDFRAAKQTLNCGTELAGFSIDDFELAARDRSGNIYNFTIKMSDENGVPYLRGNPLVRITAVGRRDE